MPQGEIRFAIDREGRVVRAAALGPVTGEDYARFALALARTHPEAAGYARIYDLRLYTGSVGHEDLLRVNDLVVAEVGEVPRIFVCVTADPGFALWARAIEAALHPPRLVRAVAAPGEAEAALAALRRGEGGDGGDAPPVL